MNPSSGSVIDTASNNTTGAYNVADLKNVSDELYNDLYVTPAESILELNVKRKLGILTQDLVRFKKFNTIPRPDFSLSLEHIPTRFNLEFNNEISRNSARKDEGRNGKRLKFFIFKFKN